ncbi:hypothetical protein TTHERM_00085020 (macronuclear) [Tetrahymena thermophila SB210]|uniref:RING-type domain-containing protein n=1 Tax=Tetrahymena thermophila (strain SB210) TaxID=312017 RepID=Q236U6_TETTS|nr:hypothetical protein TTHERM_00085020 [Tetrahymena thermophila SB210]EAR92404.1 hypothetical protein TTHERM_00085020 [Tetrahymena thermophila SB210]|eukprot:XP_001012649.1 hypothetical protein TTHERM_00085020 [Tetrahymena thermophila SB210]
MSFQSNSTDTKTYTPPFKTKNRDQGKDPIFFYTKLNKDLKEKIQEEFQYKLEDDYIYLLLESYRRDCFHEMIKVIIMLLFRDEKSFFSFFKKQNSKTHIQCLYGEGYDVQQLKNQSDPTYYLDLMNKYLRIGNQYSFIKCNLCYNLFQKINNNYQKFRDQLPQVFEYVIYKYNQTPKAYPFEKYKENPGNNTLKIRLCFLATYAQNLCTKKDSENEPFFIFQQAYCNFDKLEDTYLQETLKSGRFFVVSNKNNTKKYAFSDMPVVVDFTDEEINQPSLYLIDWYEDLQDYMMQISGSISYPKTLSQDIYRSLQVRLEKELGNFINCDLLRGKLREDQYNITLWIEARKIQKEIIQKSNILEKEQKIIRIFDYEDNLIQQRQIDPFEVEYIDPEHKCKFIYGDGLEITNYLLPNEYDSVLIENYPENENEVSFFQEFKLNYQLILSIKKKNQQLYVKCLNYALAKEFYNYFINNHLVKDKQNRLISKPLITENLYTNKAMYVMKVQYEVIHNLQGQQTIEQVFDLFIKNSYKIVENKNNVQNQNQKICYLLFDKKETGDIIKETLNQQLAYGIRFVSMDMQEIKQGKITIDHKVYIYYEELLKKIYPNEYKILLPNEQEYEEKETVQQLLQKKTQLVKKQIIRFFDDPKDNSKVNILIQSDTDKLVFKGLYEIQMVIKPKDIYQLKDTYQYHIFTNEDAKNKLKELSINNSIYIHHNHQLNRLEFYTYQTAKQSKNLVKKVIQEIEEYINKYKVSVSFNIQQSNSKGLVEYLKIKGFPYQYEHNKIQTKIVYTQFKEQLNYINENFMKPLHQNVEDCQICYDTQELFKLSNCQCKTVCKSCLKAHIKDEVITSLTHFKAQIICPSCNKQPISIRDINKIFDKFALQDLFKMRFKSGIDHLKNENGQRIFKGCDFPDCKGIMRIPYIVTKDTSDHWQCPMCQYDYCIKHILNQQYHLPLHDVHENLISCEAQIKDVGINDLEELGVIKVCPNCKAKFSHEEGCNHLTCKECKCHFCAICNWYELQQKDIYKHLQELHSGHSSNKPVSLKTANQETIEKLQKKLEKRQNNIKEGKILKADSDEEDNVFQKLKLPKSCRFQLGDVDENLLKVLFHESDFQLQQSQVSKVFNY